MLLALTKLIFCLNLSYMYLYCVHEIGSEWGALRIQ